MSTFILQGVKLRLERIKCNCAATFCRAECSVKLISREKANISGLMILFKQLHYVEYHMKTFYKHSNNEYRPMLLVLRDDFCRSYGNPSPLTPLNIMLTAFGNTSNLNQPCPWNPGEYYVKKFDFSIKHWPTSFVPEGRYILNFTGFHQPDAFLVYYEIYFEIINRGILDLRVG